MSKVNLKENIWIEGFTNEELCEFTSKSWKDFRFSLDEVLYSGKTSEIPEKLAREYVKTTPNLYEGMIVLDNHGNNVLFYNYKINDYVKRSGVRSIKSACSEEYCIIYKIN